MQGKVPELLDISKEPQRVLDAYGVKPGPGRSVRPPVPDGPPAERGRRALRRDLPARLGPPQQPAPGAEAELRRRRSADRRPAGRPGAARPAGRDAGAVRQRVRPAADRPGTGRPRPQHHRLPDVAGRRRRQEGLHLRRHRRVRHPTPSRAGCTPPTCTPRCWR